MLALPWKRQPRATLALGGGGARGLAHLGAIEALEQQGFQIERTVGVSIGSLAGALYAFSDNIGEAQRRVLEYLLSPIFQKHQETLFGAPSSSQQGPGVGGGLFAWYERIWSYLQANRIFHRVIWRSSLLPGVILQDVVDHLLPDVDIADASVPLRVVAIDLRSGREVVLEKGPLRLAVRASSSLPGIFPPVEFDGMLLSDIGVFYSLPTTVARSYQPKCLLAVDVSSELQQLETCDTALGVLLRMDEIGEAFFRNHVREFADLVLTPEVGGTEWFDFSRPEEFITLGRTAVQNAAKELARFGGRNTA